MKIRSSESHPDDGHVTQLLQAREEFDAQLHARRTRFPRAEFDRLWECVRAYYNAMRGRDWIHRTVAREFSGFREYLEIVAPSVASDVLAVADRMECMVLSDTDPNAVVEELDPWVHDNESADVNAPFYEAACAACDAFGEVDDLMLCEGCRSKFERDLLRKRDWDYSAVAFGLGPEERETERRRIIKEYGRNLELLSPSQNQDPDG